MLKFYWKNALERIAKQEATICELEQRLEDNHMRAEEIISARERQIQRLGEELNVSPHSERLALRPNRRTGSR